ncbi:MAG: hypothetical protein RXO43_03820 [Candidatus Micrarchaeota archaeon]
MEFKMNEDLLGVPKGAYRNIASQAVENIIGKNRAEKLKESTPNRELLENHLETMRSILNSYEYELVNLQKILSNTKRMKIWEMQKYLNIVEALAFGYKKILGSEIAIPLVTGIVTKSNDLYTLNKYYNMLVGEIAKKIHIANSKAKIEERKIEELTLELRYKQASILRLFKRGEIERIKRRIQNKRRKIEKYSAIAENYKKLLDDTKGFVERATE